MTVFFDGVLYQTKKQIVEKMQNNPNTSKNISNTSPTPTVMNKHNHNPICLKKKKEGKGGQRHKSWAEKLPKNNVEQVSEKQSKKKHASTSEMSSTFNKVN